MLVWRLGTAEMNPSLDPEFLASEEKRDPESYAREYGAEFYESASAFLPADTIEACVMAGRYELPPQQGMFYCAALDVAFKGDFSSKRKKRRPGNIEAVGTINQKAPSYAGPKPT